MKQNTPGAVAVYLDGVLVTNVVDYVEGAQGFVVIELKDDDGSERVTRVGKVSTLPVAPDQPPHEYAGASL